MTVCDHVYAKLEQWYYKLRPLKLIELHNDSPKTLKQHQNNKRRWDRLDETQRYWLMVKYFERFK